MLEIKNLFKSRKKNSDITNVAIDEGVDNLEIWIQTSLLKSLKKCAYIINISKKELLKNDKIVILDKPFVCFSSSKIEINDILAGELKTIIDFVNKINKKTFEKLQKGKINNIDGVDIELGYTEEYLEYI